MGGSSDFIEVDGTTGQQKVLDKKYSIYFNDSNDNGKIPDCHKDQYDSSVWIGGPNRNVVYYDQRTKIIQELPVKYTTRIISRPNEVFFVSLKGFCYWDRKTKKIAQVSEVPSKFISKSEMLNDSIVFLDGQYTYNFNSKCVQHGIYFNNYEFKSDLPSYEVKEGLGLFYENGFVA